MKAREINDSIIIYKWLLFLLQRNCLNGLQNIYKLLRGRVDEQTLGWLKQLKSNSYKLKINTVFKFTFADNSNHTIIFELTVFT
jgi:hypothetical protein